MGDNSTHFFECASCGRRMAEREAGINGKTYCHPWLSSEPTCYMKALYTRPLKFMSLEGDGDGEMVTFKVRRENDG